MWASNDPRIVFKLSDYDAFFKFEYDITVSDLRFGSDRITFTSCTMDGGDATTFWLGATDLNVTVTKLFKDNRYFYAIVSSSSETSQLQLYSPYGLPTTVWGNALGTYSFADDIITVNVSGTGDKTLYLYWKPVTSGWRSDDGGPMPTYTLTVAVQHVNGSYLPQWEVALINPYGTATNKLTSPTGNASFTVPSGTYLVQVAYAGKLYTEAITVEDDDVTITVPVGDITDADVEQPSWIRPAIFMVVCLVLVGLYVGVKKRR